MLSKRTTLTWPLCHYALTLYVYIYVYIYIYFFYLWEGGGNSKTLLNRPVHSAGPQCGPAGMLVRFCVGKCFCFR